MHIEEIKSAHRRTGGYFFEPSSMRFFKSRILPDVYEGQGGIYFVTSEQFQQEDRKYTIRVFQPDSGYIGTAGCGDFQNISTLDKAKKYAQQLAIGQS